MLGDRPVESATCVGTPAHPRSPRRSLHARHADDPPSSQTCLGRLLSCNSGKRRTFRIAMIGADRRRFRGGALPHRSFLLTRGLDATHSRATWRRPVRLRNIPIRILQILPADARLRPRRVLSESSAAAFCASHGVLRVDRGRSDALLSLAFDAYPSLKYPKTASTTTTRPMT